MKQQITVEQLQDLNTKGLDRLNSHNAFHSDLTDYRNVGGIMYPLPSIGQMIEFMGDNYAGVVARFDNPFQKYYLPADKLCDALWERVSKILNK